MRGTPVLLLGLDAADGELVEELMAQGRLPNLRRLCERGIFRRLASPAEHYAGGVWPSFYTGTDVPWHGIFHNKLWRPEAMRVEVAGEHWISSRPLWEQGGTQDMRVCLIDIPMVLGEPRPVNGVHLSGWGTHDVLGKGSWPRELWRELATRHGPPEMPPEHFGAQDPGSLEELSRSLVRATLQLRDIAIELLRQERWDLSCVVFGATHRAGHYLWDRSQVDGRAPGSAGNGASEPLLRVYEVVDEAVGDILDRLEQDTLVIAFAVHGMGPNPGWSDLLADILNALATAQGGEPPRRGLLYGLKQRLPHHWVRPVLTRLPRAVHERLVPLWSTGMYDWSETAYFPMPMDEAGYLRVNLRGREPDGIVDPADYPAVCADLERLILGLRDEDSGAPLATEVIRAYQSADPDAPYRHLLPDLVIPWNGPPASRVRRLVVGDLPGFRFEVPDRLPSGRSGNHTAGAWFAASGPGAESGRLAGVRHICELLPASLAQSGPGWEQALQVGMSTRRVALQR